ncbi:MAG TPA: TonB-dependent receptor [Cytophagales bacterium]|nr:TonB-dependent receptor [Cytophagales bacterium]HAP59848.1 TonB-dependent receptor [Cytophagales bacterium]
MYFPTDSCEYEIKGQILDVETEQPIPFATLLVEGTQKGVAADDQGAFVLDHLCEKEYNLIFSSVGYKTVKHHHDWHHGKIKIYLTPSVSTLESVVVEGEEVVGGLASVSLETMDRADLATKTTQSLASAISDISGVTLISTGTNVQLPVIHGLYGNRILIINNGVKHGFQNWGIDHAPEIDLTSANRIRVLKGAAGVQYGPEGLGGAVVVEGDPLLLSKKLYGNVATGYQSNGQGYHAQGQFGRGYEKFSYHVGAKHIRVGDRHAPNYMLTNSGMNELSANVGLRYHLPGWDFKVYYSYVQQELGLLRSSVAESGPLFIRSLAAEEPLFVREFSYQINEPKQTTTHHLANATVDWYTEVGKLSLLLSQQINHRDEFDVRRNANLPIIDLDLFTTQTLLTWDHTAFHGLEGRIGFQFFYQDNNNNPGTGTTPYIPNYNTYRGSAFVIESLQKNNTTYELGLRVDYEFNSVRGRELNQDLFRNTYDFTNVTGSLGMVHDFSQQLQLRVNVGSAWRAPNMAELYSFGQHRFKTQFGLWRYYADEEGRLRTDRVLTEEDGTSEYERGYKWINELALNKDGNQLTLTAYANLIDNFIFDRPIAVIGTIRGPMPVFIFDQTDALFLGTDLTYTREWNPNWESTLGVSYLWSQNLSKNEPLINQPPINTQAEVAWNMPAFFSLDRSKLTVQGVYTFQQFQAPRTIPPTQLISGEVVVTTDSEIFDFKDAPEGYFLGNVRWEWQRGALGGQLEVRNVFNTAYRDYLNQMRYFADDPGRNFLFSIQYKF